MRAERDVRVVVRRDGDDIVLNLNGAVGDREAELLDWLLKDLIDGQGNQSVVVDFRGALAVHPNAIRTVEHARSRARARGAQVSVST